MGREGNGMKAYILIWSYYCECKIISVHKSKEKAEQRKFDEELKEKTLQFKGVYDIEECDLEE